METSKELALYRAAEFFGFVDYLAVVGRWDLERSGLDPPKKEDVYV